MNAQFAALNNLFEIGDYRRGKLGRWRDQIEKPVYLPAGPVIGLETHGKYTGLDLFADSRVNFLRYTGPDGNAGQAAVIEFCFGFCGMGDGHPVVQQGIKDEGQKIAHGKMPVAGRGREGERHLAECFMDFRSHAGDFFEKSRINLLRTASVLARRCCRAIR